MHGTFLLLDRRLQVNMCKIPLREMCNITFSELMEQNTDILEIAMCQCFFKIKILCIPSLPGIKVNKKSEEKHFLIFFLKTSLPIKVLK